MKLIAAATALTLLSGCANMMQEASKPETYAKCAGVNLVTAALAHAALGPVAVLGVAGYFILKRLDNKTVTTAATVLTCASAVNNARIAVTHAMSPAAQPVTQRWIARHSPECRPGSPICQP